MGSLWERGALDNISQPDRPLQQIACRQTKSDLPLGAFDEQLLAFGLDEQHRRPGQVEEQEGAGLGGPTWARQGAYDVHVHRCLPEKGHVACCQGRIALENIAPRM
ncbi:hypothetical protein IH86_01680 [Sphingobium yanoikuyae]|nr:hypothetical protein IH86_01680 [Sphingobium yanoikuyae]